VTELESLPRIGPALAARIVAERNARGAFGSLDSLEARVRGIGPALAELLRTRVTFSGH
jgi:competence protein ComEA